MSSLSKEYVRVPVSATEAGAAVNPTTAGTARMAFTALGVEPVAGDWKAASWETAGSIYYARCLVGPSGTVVLANGQYDVWVEITGITPEIPILLATDRLLVT